MRLRYQPKQVLIMMITIWIFAGVMLYSDTARNVFKFVTESEFFPEDMTNDILKKSSCNTNLGTFSDVYSNDPPIFENKWGSFGKDHGQFVNPVDITIDSQSNVYVIDSDSSLDIHRIQKFSSNGNFISQWKLQDTEDKKIVYFADILIDNDDNVYVHNNQNATMQKFTKDGYFIKKWNTSIKENFVGFTIDSFDYTYGLTDRGAVKKWSTDGKLVEEWYLDNYNDVQITNPHDIATDIFDRIYLLDGSRIHKFDCHGNYLSTLSISIPDSFSTIPRDMFIDSSGFIYITSSFQSEILKFSNDGEFVTKWDSEGSVDGQFSGVGNLVVSSSGQIFVIDPGYDRIQKFI